MSIVVRRPHPHGHAGLSRPAAAKRVRPNTLSRTLPSGGEGVDRDKIRHTLPSLCLPDMWEFPLPASRQMDAAKVDVAVVSSLSSPNAYLR